MGGLSTSSSNQKQTSSSFDRYYESAALGALQKFPYIANLLPSMAVKPLQEVASLTEPTRRGMAAANTWFDTFMNPGAGTTFTGALNAVNAAQPASYVDPVTGIRGSSGYPGAMEGLDTFAQAYPAAAALFKSMFLDPQTGKLSGFWDTTILGKKKGKKYKKQLATGTPVGVGTGGFDTGGYVPGYGGTPAAANAAGLSGLAATTAGGSGGNMGFGSGYNPYVGRDMNFWNWGTVGHPGGGSMTGGGSGGGSLNWPSQGIRI